MACFVNQLVPAGFWMVRNSLRLLESHPHCAHSSATLNVLNVILANLAVTKRSLHRVHQKS